MESLPKHQDRELRSSQDYLVTHYVAEFFNTITSLAYIAYGIHGINRNKRQLVSPFAAVNAPYWGLMSVGIASGVYHASLKFKTQMGKCNSYTTFTQLISL